MLGGGTPLVAQTAASTAPYYSTFATPTAPEHYSVRSNGLLCVGCGVTNPERAADLDLDSYATLQNSVGLGTRVSMRLKMNGAAPQGHRAGVVLGSSTTLDASALGAVVLRTYQGDTPQETVLANANGVQASTLTDGRTRVEFVAAKPFTHIEVEVLITANALNTLRLYYAYGVPSNQQTTATGYLSRLITPSDNDYQATTGGGLLCVNSGVSNAAQAVTADLNDFATLTTAAGVGCTSSLQVRLEGQAPAGYQAGFVIGNGSIIDLDAFKAMRLKTYLGGTLQETATAADLLQLNVLPNGRYEVSFATNKAFDRVELVQGSLASALSNLNAYYGFGIEPRAFRDDEPVLSDFNLPQAGTDYQVSGNSLLCVGCSLQNPERAADNVFNPSDYAEMRFPLTALGTQRIKLRLNGAGKAGNLAGAVLSTNTGLLSTSLLKNVTIRTYAADGTTLLETSNSSSLVQTGLLEGGGQEVGFLTTQDFEWVEVEVRGGAGLFSNARIYYAYADDPAQGFPLSVSPPRGPLPIELVSFRAAAQGAGVVLNWQTAQERNSSHFVVERAIADGGKFVAVGRLQAAGNSSTARTYTFRDADAASLGASTLYYRLQQVDADGSAVRSGIAAVRWQSAAATLAVYPNPAAGSAFVTYGQGSWPANASLRVFSSQGKLLHQQQLHGAAPQVSLANLPAGIYHIVLYSGQQQVATQRLSVVAN
ncbi:hypothetical protein ASU33_07730 [Solirubrum puertoriconensis]|uniref:Secretion system C-terminal sorting domain-containing protein n=2 Tax=Solirubrum puertoriconensis TaxID=1751427 RepID=A0A9X0HLG0_SOLP1|nr:hypothetical protein ASU33_07730 [Solirubrum puertoriconensis]